MSMKQFTVGIVVVFVGGLIVLPIVNGPYWKMYPGPPAKSIQIFLPELKGDFLEIVRPLSIGVGEHDYKEEREISRSVNQDYVLVTTVTENVHVEAESFTGKRVKTTTVNGKTYHIELTWAEGEYTVRVNGKKIRRAFFDV